MTRFAIVLAAAGALATLALVPSPTATAAGAAEPSFDSWWHDGKAELDGYRWNGTRYGEYRDGSAVMIFVTEPWSESERVKVDDPTKNPGDVFDALKLNLVRDFQTGIYDYNTMTSTYVHSTGFSPVKVAFASEEWCGNVYDELRFDPGKLTEDRRSYFEGETGTTKLDLPADGVIEDNLFILLRGLSGDYMAPGVTKTVPFLPSLFLSRLTHRPLAWTRATIERGHATHKITVPAGTIDSFTYTVSVPGREGRFDIEAAYPHRVVRWSWQPSEKDPSKPEGLDGGELAGTQRVAYWTMNHSGGERALKDLGLTPLGGAVHE